MALIISCVKITPAIHYSLNLRVKLPLRVIRAIISSFEGLCLKLSRIDAKSGRLWASNAVEVVNVVFVLFKLNEKNFICCLPDLKCLGARTNITGLSCPRCNKGVGKKNFRCVFDRRLDLVKNFFWIIIVNGFANVIVIKRYVLYTVINLSG